MKEKLNQVPEIIGDALYHVGQWICRMFEDATDRGRKITLGGFGLMFVLLAILMTCGNTTASAQTVDGNEITEAVNNMTDLIRDLADTLGIAAEEIFGFFVWKAYWLWINPMISIALTVCMFAASRRAFNIGKQHSDVDERENWQIFGGLFGITGSVAFIITAFLLAGALKAIAAPEAWAVQEILYLIRNM